MTEFNHVATSPQGYVQQIACGWVRNGYCYYVQGVVPHGKSPALLDKKFAERYPIGMKASRRYSRKKRGVLNVAYLRYQRQWILLATPGRHESTKEGWIDWLEAERANIRNCMRGQPINVFGYSISLVRGDYLRKLTSGAPPERDGKRRVRVQISRRGMTRLREHLLGNALSRSEAWFAYQFWTLPYEPYAPVRKQLLSVLRQVNRERERSGLPKISSDVIRYHRQPGRVYV